MGPLSVGQIVLGMIKLDLCLSQTLQELRDFAARVRSRAGEGSIVDLKSGVL